MYLPAIAPNDEWRHDIRGRECNGFVLVKTKPGYIASVISLLFRRRQPSTCDSQSQRVAQTVTILCYIGRLTREPHSMPLFQLRCD